MSSSKPLATKKSQSLSLTTSCTSLAISAILFWIFTFLYTHDYCNQHFALFNPFELKYFGNISSPPPINYPTNISHIKFIMVTSTKTWHSRKSYIEAWWLPNQTRGNIFLDSPPAKELLPWPSSCPPFQVNEDVKKLRVYKQLVVPDAARIFRSIMETFKLGDDGDVRWYVMGDDDTVFMVHNLVEVLAKYDHRKYYYIGMVSEAIKSNVDFSFNMAYGGGGYALSYSLVQALVPSIDACLERYPHLRVSDQLLSACLADLGVELTMEKGFHQIDFLGDISGLLSSHPQSPFISLHHFDVVDPIFPFKDRHESVHHLMKAARLDESRLLQQTVCYHRPTNWSFSLSWGYSAHVYQHIIPRSTLRKPLETFSPFKKSAKPPFYVFNTRPLSHDPCQMPHVFFLESVNFNVENGELVTTYNRTTPRGSLGLCSSSGNHSADPIATIRVVLQSTTRKQAELVECCDVNYMNGTNVADIRLRPCSGVEVIA